MATWFSQVPEEIRAPLLWATLLPGGLALISCAALLRLMKGGDGSPRPLVAALGLLLPLLIGAGAFGVPQEKWQRFIYLLAAVVVLAMLAGSINRSWAFTLAAVLASGLAAAGWIWWELYLDEPFWIRMIPAAALLILVLGLEPLAQRERDGRAALFPAALAIAAGAMAAILVLSGNQFFAIYCASAAAVLAVGAVASAFSPSFTLSGGTLVPIALILTTMPHLAWLYVAGLPRAFIAAFILAAGAPLMLWPIVLLTTKLPAWARFLLGLVAVAIAAGLALAIAISNSDLGAYGY